MAPSLAFKRSFTGITLGRTSPSIREASAANQWTEATLMMMLSAEGEGKGREHRWWVAREGRNTT